MNINGTQGSPYQGLVQIRPYDFGTDAIERQRVSLGQSLIDADFEYGLQNTKWQTFQELRKFPSFYEIPGTDLTVSNIQVDGTTSGNVTVYFSNAASLPPPLGSVISVQGLANSARTADRAEGFFLVTSNVGSSSTLLANTCNYISKGQIAASNVNTAYTVVRRGGIFNNSTLKVPVAAIVADTSPGTNVQVQTSNAHGLALGTPVTANSSGSTFNGNFFVSNIPSPNTFNIVCSSTVTVASAANSNIYMNPYSYAVHRPFDGGVLLSSNQPSQGAAMVRQSKKVFRYQSGKGLLFSSGTLFAPNNDVTSVVASSSTSLTITTDIPHGAPQSGATILIKGIASPSTINGTYTIASVIDTRTLTVNTNTDYTGQTITLADQPRFVITNWHGASVRAGTFEDQNGMFWEYDGQTLFAVKRSSTFQLDGYVTVDPQGQLLTGQITTTGTASSGTVSTIPIGYSNATITSYGGVSLAAGYWTSSLAGYQGLGPVWVTSTSSGGSIVQISFAPATTAYSSGNSINNTVFNLSNTRFADQLKVNDRITIRGMTHQVTSIMGQGLLTFNPPFRGSQSITSSAPVKPCKIKELRVPQNLFNRDTLDGFGQSGFKFDAGKMQMTGIQYTWYGAGFVDFMMRGADGNWVYAHRMKNNNINDEAYMRTGNMPVRYEIVNECQSASTTLNGQITGTSMILNVNDSTQFFPPSGTLLIDNEYISYSSKTATSFVVSSREAPLVYNINDVSRTFTGAPASYHNDKSSVTLASVTCSPSLTHWGSAFLMDGNFDNDRGYFFNYSNVNVSIGTTPGSVTNAFAIRLAPSVSNGVVGDIGTRELLNRAQLLLQKLEVTSANTITTTGILNPVGITFDPTKWVNVTTIGGQPSFAQIYPGNLLATGAGTPGERIFQSIVQTNNQNNLDLSNLKEMSNAVIGGNQPFPDGPDVLLIQIINTSTIPANSTCQVNLFWTEAQA